MRIEKHTASGLNAKLAATAGEQAKLLEKLATGKRINRASDDAAGLAIAKEFEKQIRTFRNASENVNAGMSALAIADGSVASISEMLQRQRELAIQSANGTLNDDQRGGLDREFQSLSLEIDRVSKSTSFNGINLLDGTGPLADGTGGVRAGDKEGDAIVFSATDVTLSGLGLGSTGIGSSESSLQALNAIDTAMNRVNDKRSSHGGASNRLEHALNNLGTQMVNTAKGLSAVEDLDFAQALTEKVKTDMIRDANTAAVSHFNDISRTHLLALLR